MDHPGPRNVVFVGHPTTAAAANCHITTTGDIYRSTSSRRYKTDVQPAEVDTDAVLALQPQTFRTLTEVAEQGDEAGEVDGFAYSTWSVALHAVVQQHRDRITDLEATVAEQADTIAGLTARRNRWSEQPRDSVRRGPPSCPPLPPRHR